MCRQKQEFRGESELLLETLFSPSSHQSHGPDHLVLMSDIISSFFQTGTEVKSEHEGGQMLHACDTPECVCVQTCVCVSTVEHGRWDADL